MRATRFDRCDNYLQLMEAGVPGKSGVAVLHLAKEEPEVEADLAPTLHRNKEGNSAVALLMILRIAIKMQDVQVRYYK